MRNDAFTISPKGYSNTSLFFSFVLSSAIMYALYSLFFEYSPIIWSFNPRLPISDYTPWVRWAVAEKNGIQQYVLYALMIFYIYINVILNNIFAKMNNQFVSKFFMPLLVLTAVFFYKHIGFLPPMAEIGKSYSYAYFMIFVFLILLALSILIVKYPKTTNYLIAAILIPMCLISTRELRFYDATYIFSPGLRILHGFKPYETYFQYDYLLSLLSAIWMKAHFAIRAFKIPMQVSYYGLLLGIYLFAQKLFLHKRYALYLLISLVLFKIYGNMYDPIYMVQVVPLRLDLWFIVLVLAYFKGLGHWTLGLVLSFLVIAHHNFGLVYAASYLVLMAALFIFEAMEKKSAIKKMANKYLSIYWLNIFMLLASLLIYGFFFGPIIGNAVFSFQKIGLGFMPIAYNSFYWYIAVMLGMVFTIIINSKGHISYRVFETSIFLVVLTIGNSLYFFGRSHENNIINISASWLFCLFLLFDLMDDQLQANSKLKIKKAIMPAISLIAVLIFAHSYSGRAMDRIKLQYDNIREGHLTSNDPALNMDHVRVLTRFDIKVIFLSQLDFFYYYLGGYVPQDYYALIYARVFKKDTIDYLNSKLADGYYLIIPAIEYGDFAELIDALKYKNRKSDSGLIVISNGPIG